MNQHFYTKQFFTFLVVIIVYCSSCATGNKIANSKNSMPERNEVGAAAMPDNIEPIKAPFAMPQLQKPVFPSLRKSIVTNGAKAGTKVTNQINQAIEQVHQQGGGTVVIPEGKWHTGRINLLSNVNLEIAEGAEVYFSGAIEDYQPAVFTRNEGIEVMSLGALIYANGQRNIAVTGKGRLIGPEKGSPIRKKIMTKDVIENVIDHKTPVPERMYDGLTSDFMFPVMFISPINCNNVLIEGINLENTAFWNVVPVYCDSVIIRGITVHSVGIPRGDGIDVESSRNVLIEYCTLSTGDDAFTIKAGRGDDGLRVGKPTENVVVRYGLVLEGHSGVTCGSETAAMIRNLYVHDCVFEKTRSAIRFKTRRPRGGGGENLFYENIKSTGGKYVFEWDMLGSATYVGALASRDNVIPKNHLTPSFSKIKAKNIVAENIDQFIKATGIPESPLKDVLIENVTVSAKNLINISDADGIIIKNSSVTAQNPTIDLLDARNIEFNNVKFISPANALKVAVSGPLSKNIQFIKTSPAKPDNWKSGNWQKN